MLSAGMGGIRPGLLAIALSILVFAYYFISPSGSLLMENAQLPRLFIFSISILFVGLLSAAQRSAAQSLARTKAALENTIRQLKQSNAALHEEASLRLRAQERVDYLAHYDTLTGLANRALLQDRISQAVAYAGRDKSALAVLFLDLDHFKQINESLGHRMGDQLLKMVAQRLCACLDEGISAARIGADEFVLILPLISNSEVVLFAQKILAAINETFSFEGQELHLSASIGIGIYPDDGDNAELLMRAAYTAMNHAKRKGRNTYQFYTQTLNLAAQHRLHAANRLHRAVHHEEFEVYYQPQVLMADGSIFSAEALLRWKQPGAAPQPCGAFIAIAEETGLIVPLGEWVLRQACMQLKKWHDLGHPHMHVEVNLSVRQFAQPNLQNLVKRILEESAIAPVCLGLEITESVLLHTSADNLSVLRQLKDLGVRLSVDDFGTGYSSLAYLQRFPVSALKIDQSFVRGIGENANNTALVAAIIAMAQSLELNVVAEGVEKAEQAAFLQSHHCVAAQGFYYSRAVPAGEFTRLLEQHRDCPARDDFLV